MRRTRPRSRPTAVALLAPLAAVALLLGACSDGGGTDPTPEASEPAEEGADDEPEAEPEPEAGASSGGAACVEGTWLSDAESQAAATTSGLGMAELGAVATVTGDAVTTIAGSSMTTEYRDMVVRVSWSQEGQEFVLTNSWSGTLVGTIEVTDEQIVISGVDTAGLELSYEAAVNGEVMDIPGLAEIPLSGMAAGGTSTYTCDSDELRMTPVVDGVDTTGFVTVLHRQ